jgi:hypothetical protein
MWDFSVALKSREAATSPPIAASAPVGSIVARTIGSIVASARSDRASPAPLPASGIDTTATVRAGLTSTSEP